MCPPLRQIGWCDESDGTLLRTGLGCSDFLNVFRDKEDNDSCWLGKERKNAYFILLYFIFGRSNRHCCHRGRLDVSILNQIVMLYCHTVVEVWTFICQLGFRLQIFT